MQVPQILTSLFLLPFFLHTFPPFLSLSYISRIPLVFKYFIFKKKVIYITTEK